MDKIDGYHCRKCHHEWKPRQDAPPKKCPRCQADDWQEPDKEAKP